MTAPSCATWPRPASAAIACAATPFRWAGRRWARRSSPAASSGSTTSRPTPTPTRRPAGSLVVRSLLIVPIVRRFEAVGVIVAGDRVDLRRRRRRTTSGSCRRTRRGRCSCSSSTRRSQRSAAAQMRSSGSSPQRSATPPAARPCGGWSRRRSGSGAGSRSSCTTRPGSRSPPCSWACGASRRAHDPAAVRATVEELRATVVNAVQELRALAVELRPKALDDFGLSPGARAPDRHLQPADGPRWSTLTSPGSSHVFRSR